MRPAGKLSGAQSTNEELQTANEELVSAATS
jgi:hypothetical protein